MTEKILSLGGRGSGKSEFIRQHRAQLLEIDEMATMVISYKKSKERGLTPRTCGTPKGGWFNFDAPKTEPKPLKGPTPNKYTPHQGAKERARRLKS